MLCAFVLTLFAIAIPIATMRTPRHLRDREREATRNNLGVATNLYRYPLTERTVFLLDSVSVWGWPSRGGLIVLNHVTSLDFDFLGLDPIHPPMRRDPNQEAEDRLCQRLLLLGAKWFDSRDRYGFVANVVDDHDPTILALEAGEVQAPTTMERRWVSVGYPGELNGGLWVAEYDTVMYGMQEKYNLLPEGSIQVSLANTMDMKCEILKSIGAKFYTSLEQYDGAACLRAWEKKTTGEFGPLVQTKYEEE